MSDAPPETRRITRSRDDRILGGVAAGFARYLGVDPVIVRLGFVVAAVIGGIGVLAYVAAWLLVPDDAETQPTGRRPALRQLAGFALLGIGLLVTVGQFDLWVDEQAVWALCLIAVGGAVLWARGRDRREPDASPPSTDGPPPPAAPPPPADAPPTPSPPAPSPPAPRPPAVPHRAVPPGAPSWPPPTPPPAPPAPGSAVAVAAPRRPTSMLGLLTLLVVLVGTGVAIALDASGVVDVPAGVVLAGALVVIGLALVVGAWRGRARWLTIPGVALALLAAATSALDLPLAGGIGERDYQPTSFAAVDDHYELGIGSLELDLRDLDFRNRVERVRASVGIGELKVWVPDGVRVVVDGEVSVGELATFGDQDAGTNVEDRVVRPGTEGGGTLLLELRDGIGSIQVFDADHGGPT